MFSAFTDDEDENATLSFFIRLIGQDCFHLYYIPEDDDGVTDEGITLRGKSGNGTLGAGVDDDGEGLGLNGTAVPAANSTMTSVPLTTNMLKAMLGKNSTTAESLAAELGFNVSSNSSSLISSGLDGDVKFLYCPDRVESLFKTYKENHFEYTFVPLREISISPGATGVGYR